LGLHDKVDFIFDDRVMEKKKIRDAWDSFKENAAAEARPYIGSDPRFEDDKEFLPLQAADLIAWVDYEKWQPKKDKSPRSRGSQAMKSLAFNSTATKRCS
jgi:hypothetical protein